MRCTCRGPAAYAGPVRQDKKSSRRLSLLRSSSLKRWNRRRDETILYNSWTTQSGEFRTPYDQVTHLDGGRCNAPAPTSSCGWLHQHNSGTTQSGEFRTPYDQVPHLDGGRCNAPAPTLFCGWLNYLYYSFLFIQQYISGPISL